MSFIGFVSFCEELDGSLFGVLFGVSMLGKVVSGVRCVLVGVFNGVTFISNNWSNTFLILVSSLLT